MDEQSDSRKVKKPRRPKGSGGIRNRGSERHPRWFAYHEVVVDGQTRQVTRGPFPRKKDAENWLKDELQRVREGRPTLPSKITVAELLAEWLAARKPSLEPNTFREYDRIAEHRIKPLIGHHKVRDLRPGHVSKMFDELRKPGGNRRGRQDRGLSETSLQHTHTVLRSAIEHAIRQRVVTYNVMDDVDRPRRDRKRMRVWSAAELAAFLDHAASDRLFPLLRLASHSGARRSELLGLRWTDVDLEAGSISVASRRTRVGYQMVERPGTKTVAGSRVIDLDPDTTAILRRWRDTQDAERSAWGVACVTSGYVFTNEDGSAVHADHVANRFERLVAGAKVPSIRFHDVRHTHATLLLRAKVPVHVVAQRLGHASPALTLSIYSHVLPRQQSEAAADFAKLVVRSSATRPPSASVTECPGCGHESVTWEAQISGGPALLDHDGTWLATDFDSSATDAELILTCDACGWTKTIAAGDWEAR
jgi:integrase